MMAPSLSRVFIPPALLVARSLSESFEWAGIEHAVGGSIACCLPREPHDVDMMAFIEGSRPVGELLSAVRAAGCGPCVIERNRVVASSRGVKIDLYVARSPFAERARRRLRTVEAAGRMVPSISPEDVAVLKVVLFREKDREDVRWMASRPGFDLRHVRRELSESIGHRDERTLWVAGGCR